VEVSVLDAMPGDEARALLAACCAAPAWVDRMLAARPWRDRDGLLAAADRAWAACPREAIAEAIAHHPRLGESAAAAPLGGRERAWSAEEQRGTQVAAEDVKQALAHGNAAYEERFGHTFILCASGLSAEAMLASLRQRMANDRETEHARTAHELLKITRLRLERLLAGGDARRETGRRVP
jgi:2-oxo-4-hydroxy-4-carboxy-5-ureidoimidazoline decarboxylase